MHPTIERLLSGGPVVTDGAWGTQMQQRGLPVGACPDAWNLEQPEKVEEVARAYVDAGSRVILTNTFGANRIMLARHDLADQVAEINRTGVEISKRAAGERAAVFASIGPCGLILMTGDVSESELRAAFAEQARAIADAGADAIVVETMSDPAEAKLAVAAAGGLGPLAWPEKVEVIRRVSKNKEEIVLVNLKKIAEGSQPDFFMKPKDIINVGTHPTSRWLAVLRNAFRASYGFGFIYDRNFADRDIGRHRNLHNSVPFF